MYLDTGLVVGALSVIAVLVGIIYRNVEQRIDRECKQLRDDMLRAQQTADERHHRNRTEQMGLHEFDKKLQFTLESMFDDDRRRTARALTDLTAMARGKGGLILDENSEPAG